MKNKVLLILLLVGLLILPNASFAVQPDFNKMNAKELGEWVENNSEGERFKGYGIPSQENVDEIELFNYDSDWMSTRRHQNTSRNYWQFIATMYSVAEWKVDDSANVTDYRKKEHTLTLGSNVRGIKSYAAYKPNSKLARVTFTAELVTSFDENIHLVHTYFLRNNSREYEYQLEEL